MTDSEMVGGAALLDGPYVPSPIPRIRDQVAGYLESGGSRDNTLEGKPVVILTTVGETSLQVRKNPVMRVLEGDTYVAVASAGGAPKDPQWYRNLKAHPVVGLQDGDQQTIRIAREIHGAEKDRWWKVAESFWPHYPEYRAESVGRDIPVVLLERPQGVDNATPAEVKSSDGLGTSPGRRGWE